MVGEPALEFLFGARVALLLMFGERLVEVLDVDFKSYLLGKLDRHFDREAVGVVKLEACLAADRIADEVMAKLFEFLYAALKGAFETLLFGRDFVYDAVAIDFEFGINVLILLDNRFGNHGKLADFDVELFGKAHGPAKETAKDIALIDV